MTLLFVILGGAVGAPLRYLTDLYVQSKHDSAFPWGTLTVNVVGSAVLGESWPRRRPETCRRISSRCWGRGCAAR